MAFLEPSTGAHWRLVFSCHKIGVREKKPLFHGDRGHVPRQPENDLFPPAKFTLLSELEQRQFPELPISERQHGPIVKALMDVCFGHLKSFGRFKCCQPGL